MPHTPGFPAIPGLYGISVTAELSGFTIATLRLYEQHGLITPARTRGGTRRYSARVALPSSHTSWEKYVEDYDRIRDTMSKAHDGFEDFNRRVRLPLGFRIRQPARELIFLTPSGRAEFSAAPLPDETTGPDTLILATIRSHDQWNTTIYSDNDRYRGIKICAPSSSSIPTTCMPGRSENSTTSTSSPKPATEALDPCCVTRQSLRHSTRLHSRLHARDERVMRDR
ncbi:hypothetical protein GCM10020255_014510 [Rhodococcus baikonurensis]